MSLKSDFFLDITPKEWQDCKYYMIEQNGLQFVLRGQKRRDFLAWVVRSRDKVYKQRIEDFIKSMEDVNEKE